VSVVKLTRYDPQARVLGSAVYVNLDRVAFYLPIDEDDQEYTIVGYGPGSGDTGEMLHIVAELPWQIFAAGGITANEPPVLMS
jgi:hypothetical protein